MTEALSRLNFRDLGGLPIAGGGHVRSGIVYRSEGPANFDARHRAELADLDIRLVCDLRAAAERDHAPNDWTAAARLLNLDITNDLRSETNAGWGALRHDPSAAGAKAAMTLNYVAVPGSLLPHLRRLIEAIVAGETPVLIHCTAGKDRTGVLIALLLRALDVPEAAIQADYARSDVFGQNMRMAGGIAEMFEATFGFPPSQATIDTMIGVDADFLHAALAVVTERWGSIDDYFAAAGVDATMMARYRVAMIDPA